MKLKIKEKLNLQTNEMEYILYSMPGCKEISRAVYFAYACERQEHPTQVINNISKILTKNCIDKKVSYKQIRSFFAYNFASIFFSIYNYEKEIFKQNNITVKFIKKKNIYLLKFPYVQYFKSIYFDFLINCKDYYQEKESICFEIKKEVFENNLSKKIKIL